MAEKGSNTGLIIGAVVVLGAILLATSRKGGGSNSGSGERTATVPIPYPNGTPTKVKESELAQYGYVVDTDGKIYHTSQLQAPTGTQGSQPTNWAATIQNFINQGMTAYTAINQAVAPKITVVPNWVTGTFQYTFQDGFTSKTGTGTRGVSSGIQINNTKYGEINANTNTTVLEIKKLSDDSVVATKTVDWVNKTMS